MSDAAAILATFATWRPVQGRKVLQLIFEVPLEDQGKVLTHLGAPMPGEQKWCGIALVTRKGKAGETGATTVVSGSSMAASDEAPPAGNSKPKRRWQDMPPSQRAALLTKDGEFQLFTSWVLALKDERASEAVANEFILTRCGVESKATLDTDKGERRFFRDQFDKIESEFEAFRQARGHGVI